MSILLAHDLSLEDSDTSNIFLLKTYDNRYFIVVTECVQIAEIDRTSAQVYYEELPVCEVTREQAFGK